MPKSNIETPSHYIEERLTYVGGDPEATLLIGGPGDGQIIRAATEHRRVLYRASQDPSEEVYYREEIFFTGKHTIRFFVVDGMPVEEAFIRLASHYRPRAERIRGGIGRTLPGH